MQDGPPYKNTRERMRAGSMGLVYWPAGDGDSGGDSTRSRWVHKSRKTKKRQRKSNRSETGIVSSGKYDAREGR